MKLIEAHNHLLTKHNVIVPLHYFSFIISNKQFINNNVKYFDGEARPLWFQ